MKEVFDPFMYQTEDQNKKIISNKNGRFPCRKCNKTFSLKIQARRHEKRSCKGQFTYQNKKIVSNETERFPCSNCNQTFSSKNGARRHRMNCKNENRPNNFFTSSLDASNGFTNPALPMSVIKIEPQDVTQDEIADQIEDHFAIDQKDIICQPNIITFAKLEHKVSLPERKTTPNKEKILNQNEKEAKFEIEDRVANSNGRFPCKYCNQTFSKSIYAMSHEKKSCKKSKSNKTKPKIMEKVSDPFMDQTEVEDLSANKIEIQSTNESIQEVFDPFMFL